MLFTVGYEGRSIQQFLADLHGAKVSMLVDVREAPVSRKPGFSKNALAQMLCDAGIGYRHIRALGCPKSIRDQHKLDGDWSAYTRSFMDHLSQQQPSLEELRAVAVSQRAAVLCYEADFNFCHRTYVARAVAQRAGLRIWHITPDGLVEDRAVRAA
jgi:uncharacterized protein (DUF488 family)